VLRRYRYLVAEYSNELGTELTEPEKALVRQVSSLQLRIEQLQGRIVQGEDVDADQIIRLASEHRRLLSQLSGRAVLRWQTISERTTALRSPMERGPRESQEGDGQTTD
jgi:hypothetical protein